MSRRQILIGYTTEGPTDNRFLGSVIQRTFEKIGFECRGEVDVLPVQYISVPKTNFIDTTVRAAQQADEIGLMVLCVHTDADNKTDVQAFKTRIEPDFRSAEIYVKSLVAIVPVQMTEAWMLADTNLLKNEIGSSNSDEHLGFNKRPEEYVNPKDIIQKGIAIAYQHLPRRRALPLNIAELYSPIGQKIDLGKLTKLDSYKKFEENVRKVYQKMHFMD
jgi:hypothetical protein